MTKFCFKLNYIRNEFCNRQVISNIISSKRINNLVCLLTNSATNYFVSTNKIWDRFFYEIFRLRMSFADFETNFATGQVCLTHICIWDGFSHEKFHFRNSASKKLKNWIVYTLESKFDTDLSELDRYLSQILSQKNSFAKIKNFAMNLWWIWHESQTDSCRSQNFFVSVVWYMGSWSVTIDLTV